MIIDISTERANELGVNWSGRVGRMNFGRGDTSAPATSGMLTLGFSSGAAAAGNFLLSQLRLLETAGDAEIQSRPSILTTENLSALLDLSETFYIRTVGDHVANVTPVTAGTTLRVTPQVMDLEGRKLVRMKIDIEDGQLGDRTVDALPTVRRSSVSTEAVVRHGEALLIAGYTSNHMVASKQQVPVLGDIPVAGTLFSDKVKTVQKRERMFLIRPKVVDSLAGPGAMADKPSDAAMPADQAPGAGVIQPQRSFEE